jgi:sulfide:quinone oxidoreductase
MKHRLLILGAGFGGLELATRLESTIGDDVNITLIDRSDFFVLGFAKLEVLFGRKTASQIKNYYRDLSSGIDFRQEQIESIDPELRQVNTNIATYQADTLVVALGADLHAEATPGLTQHGHDFYSMAGVEKLHSALTSFKSGTVLIGILGVPYKCPPAPFEAALQLHDYLVERGERSNVTIRVLSPAPTPLPISKEGSETIIRLLVEREIEFLPGHQVTSINGSTKHAVLKDGTSLPYDLFMGVPVHRVPPAVNASGLVQEGWIPVNPVNLETKFTNVFAIGDVTRIPVGNATIPKAGAFADRAAQTVADEIQYRLRGTGAPGLFDGSGTCYLEFGNGNVAKIEGNYFGGPAPQVRFTGPSPDLLVDKLGFGETRLARWFKKVR